MLDRGADGDQEVPFPIEDIIYSRTDPRGVILSANLIFERMSGHGAAEWCNTPHRFVRHADMPKGFFHIFWDELRQGRPLLGYIKNRTRTGGHYWTFACAVACEGGYFSARVRPLSPLFDLMRAEYAALLILEEAEKLSAQDSAVVFLDRLKQLGYRSYAEFMAHAAAEEECARRQSLGGTAEASDDHICTLSRILADAQVQQDHLVALFADLRLLPVNMRLVAARIEPQGGPISQISVNYKIASDEITRRLSSYVTGDANLCGQLAIAVRHSLVLTHCANLLIELVERPRFLTLSHPLPRIMTEADILRQVEQLCAERARAALDGSAGLARRLAEASHDVRRMVLGLDTIRILGRVESRRDRLSESSLTATIDQIDKVQAEISASLKRLTDLTATILTLLVSLRGGAPVRLVAE